MLRGPHEILLRAACSPQAACLSPLVSIKQLFDPGEMLRTNTNFLYKSQLKFYCLLPTIICVRQHIQHLQISRQNTDPVTVDIDVRVCLSEIEMTINCAVEAIPTVPLMFSVLCNKMLFNVIYFSCCIIFARYFG